MGGKRKSKPKKKTKAQKMAVANKAKYGGTASAAKANKAAGKKQQPHVMLSLNKPKCKPLVVRRLASVSLNRNELQMQATASADTRKLNLM